MNRVKNMMKNTEPFKHVKKMINKVIPVSKNYFHVRNPKFIIDFKIL